MYRHRRHEQDMTEEEILQEKRLTEALMSEQHVKLKTHKKKQITQVLFSLTANRSGDDDYNNWAGSGSSGDVCAELDFSFLRAIEECEESSFMRSITESIEAKLQRCLDVKSSLKRDDRVDKSLKNDLIKKIKSNEKYQRMLQFREKLPAYKLQRDIINLIEENQVVLLTGETGCGKTTQVAQFILDDMILNDRGSACHIVCTQPRRISATSVAHRVAEERDDICGEYGSVGYQIRLEKRVGRKYGSIMYCTTGILLRKMQSDPVMLDVSHLVLDEIHERDVNIDFLMTILKDILPKRPDLKVILMSATLNAEKFQEYYNNCPVISIPGYTYPVKDYYLEDILVQTNFQFTPPPKTRGFMSQREQKENAKKIESYASFMSPFIRQLSNEGYPQRVLDILRNPDSEELNIDLIAALIKKIDLTGIEGAILVFLPGLEEITKLCDLLTSSHDFPHERFLVIPLHSIMPTIEQNTVFEKPPEGVRKIVVATNIAETSITIDDVIFVIDSGKMKMKQYDVKQNLSSLQTEWVTLANSRQRKGRAGRTQPGVCYHMYTKARETQFDDYPLPEMLRTRLEEVILLVKIHQMGRAKHFLERVMDPPDSRAVDTSLTMLRKLNALDEEERLTLLGFHLAKLPLDPQTAKMILMGAVFGCVDPIFTIAAILSYKDPFTVPMKKQAEVTEKKRGFAKDTKSDHLMLFEAMKSWDNCKGKKERKEFCYDNYLSQQTLIQLKDIKVEFAEHLSDMGFLHSANPKDPKVNVNSGNTDLLKAVVCAGLYPNVAMVREVIFEARIGRYRIRATTPEDGPVRIHPRSINENVYSFESPFLLYHKKLKTSAIFLHDTTMVSPLALAFFGERAQYVEKRDHSYIEVSDSLKLRCGETTCTLIKVLRKQLDRLLEHHILHPQPFDWEVPSKERTILRAIIELLTEDDRDSEVDNLSALLLKCC